MSLITRCPACGTMFKVVTDQLKVSQGWVRCGYCSEVFDATLYLQTAQPPGDQVPSPHFDDVPAAFQQRFESPSPAASPHSVSTTPQRDQDASIADPGYSIDPSDWKEPDQLTALAVPFHLDSNAESLQSVMPQAFVQESLVDAAASSGEDFAAARHDGLHDEAHDVSFVRNARRQAFWSKPLVRVALGMLCLLLAALLLLQLVVQQRDTLAALEPQLKPTLQTLCVYLQCETGPVRRIESVVIDSSSFNKISSGSYRLGFSLKNTGTTPVAMPSLEVTLTDTQDQPLVRRVLAPGQFGATGNQLVVGSDFAGLVVLQVLNQDGGASILGSGRVAGYRVLAFYP